MGRRRDKPGKPGRPKHFDPPRYLLNVKSRLYIGQFDNLIHAFAHWKRLVDRDSWFMVSTERAGEITIRPGPRWHKLDEPRPMRVRPPNSVYPGRYNAQNKPSAKRFWKHDANGKFCA